MVETEIKIIANRKSDINLIIKSITDSRIRFPVYIFELDTYHKVEFVSDYEEWELDDTILLNFPEYEFTKNLEKGKKEIRLQIARNQSGLDVWGRPPESPLNETKYLVRKSTDSSEVYNPMVKVLFEGVEQNYFINTVEGINKLTGERGFLLSSDFKSNDGIDDSNILKDRLYKTANEAFHFGYYKMQDVVNRDFKKYIQEKKKKIVEINKVPRKVVKEFIDFCNGNNIDSILKLVDNQIIFEKKTNWKITFRTEGIQQFKEYLLSPDQTLCSNQFKIRSSWNVHLPTVSISVKFFPSNVENNQNSSAFVKYKQLSFVIDKDKIKYIVEQ